MTSLECGVTHNLNQRDWSCVRMYPLLVSVIVGAGGLLASGQSRFKNCALTHDTLLIEMGRHDENSLVLPPGSVAVVVIKLFAATFESVFEKYRLPLASVCALALSRNVSP